MKNISNYSLYFSGLILFVGVLYQISIGNGINSGGEAPVSGLITVLLAAPFFLLGIILKAIFDSKTKK